MICVCKEWQENISKVDAPVILQAIRSGTIGYTGLCFKYCPWCGTTLIEEES